MLARIAHYRTLVGKAASLPPHVVARKVGARLSAPLVQATRRQRDRMLSTSCIGRGTHPVTSVLRRIESLPSSLLSAHAGSLQILSQHYRAHRFNLLGSGWIEVRYGTSCPGLAGHRYAAADAVQADPHGNWLRGRVPASFLSTAREVWRHVDADYQPIDWQLDFKSGYRWSARTWFRDVRYGHLPGVDVKVPWELARMQHLPQLALAHRLSISSSEGFARPAAYAKEFRNQLLDFIATNPPRFGVNWACTMDVALRAVNWLLAYDLFRATGATFDDAFAAILIDSLFDHARHIAQHLEWCELARGNHYLADVVGLLLLAAYLPPCEETDRWLVVATHEFVKECGLQFRADGTNFEGSTCYHRLSTEMAVFGTAILLGLESNRRETLQRGLASPWRKGPRIEAAPLPMHEIDGRLLPFGPEHLSRLIRAAQFTQAITKPGGQVVQIGDNDSGRFTKLTPVLERQADSRGPQDDSLDHGSLVAQVAGLFTPRTTPELAGKFACDEHIVRQLALGGVRRQTSACNVVHAPSSPPRSMNTRPQPTGRTQRREYVVAAEGDLVAGLQRQAFEDFGLYIYRSPRMFLAIRCGGRGQIAPGGHEHCDQLSVELEIDGRAVIRDPGSFVYTPLPGQRNRYRSASAHFVPHFGALDEQLYPEDLSAGLFQLPAIRRATCHAFDPQVFMASRTVGQRVVTRRVEIAAHEVRIVDECSDGAQQTSAIETWRTIPFSSAYGVQQHHGAQALRLVETPPSQRHTHLQIAPTRVLVVTERYPPANDPRALRWGAIVRQWREQGIDVRVVAPKRAAETSFKPVKNAGLSVTAMRWLKLFYRQTWGKLWWPDYACWWQLLAMRQASALLKRERFDALVTVSNPYSDHLTGLLLKRRFPSLRWLADVGDPFSLPDAPPVNNHRLFRTLNARFERAVFEQADIVTVTNEATRAAYQQRFASAASKIQVVPPLYAGAIDDCSNARTAKARRHLLFAGRLYRGLRSPTPLLEWFRALVDSSTDDWHLHFFGDVESCRDEFAPFADLLGERIWLHGTTGHAIVQRALREAYVLVNLGNDNPHQVPSKLVEYMAAGRPILNFAGRTQDTSVELLRGYPLQHCVVPWATSGDVERAMQFVSRHHDAIDAGRLLELLKPFLAASVAERYGQLLRDGAKRPSMPRPHSAALVSNSLRQHVVEPASTS